MRTTAMTLAIAVLLLTAGCKNQSTTATVSSNEPGATAQANMTPEQLGELGAKIGKQPEDAKRLLSENGFTEQSFEQAIRKVSEDPAASKRYAEAYKKASA